MTPDNTFTLGHVTKWNLNISSSTRPTITRLCRVVAYDDGNSSIMPLDFLTTKSREVAWQTKNKISPPFTTPVTTKLGRIVTCPEGNSPIMSQDPPIMWSHEVTRQIKDLLFCKVCITRCGRVVTYDEEKLFIKSHDPLITCLPDVTWQIKDEISSLRQGL